MTKTNQPNERSNLCQPKGDLPQNFVSLCGERKTQERIAHTLKTGKPLRN